jgi:uncharacterized integral membrane protein
MNKNVKHGAIAPLYSGESELLLKNEYKTNKIVTNVNLPLSARCIVIPSLDNNLSKGKNRRIVMTDDTEPDKDALYRLIIAAYNYVYNDKSAAITAKLMFNRHAAIFIEWLNRVKIINRYNLLKDYETYRFDLLNSHGGASVLANLKTLFTYALDYSTELYSSLSRDEINFLEELRKTPISPNLNKRQISLASYFGGMSWLRYSNIGIGNELYSALASPKLAIKSLTITASTIIVALNTYKEALRVFFKKMTIDASYFVLPNCGACVKQRYKGTIIYEIITKYHLESQPKELLKNAIKCLLLSNVRNEGALNRVLKALNSQAECDSIFLNKVSPKNLVNADFSAVTFSSTSSCGLFSFDILHSLASEDSKFPVTTIEEVTFQWLMASYTVQPSDIKKLTEKSFKLLKVSGKVRHIECKYFKGRAKVFHTTRSVSSRSIEGKAILTYLKMKKSGECLSSLSMDYMISSKFSSLSGVLRKLITLKCINEKLVGEHQKQENLPLIIPYALDALIGNGIHAHNVIRINTKSTSLKVRSNLASQSETPSHTHLFRLMHIKNSAVHAFSDPYTLEYLVNRNSHSNKTEKVNYLTNENTQWINSSGRITREVMFDLINNVFYLNFGDKDKEKDGKVVEQFNSEFMSVTSNISYRTGEMIARLKIVTGQRKGKINEVGVLALNGEISSERFSPIYVLDSPVTAWKMHNYLHEFKKNYKKLLAHNPEYFYRSVLPSVEWVEHTLNKLSKANERQGFKIFENALKNNVVVSVFHSI